MFGGWIELAKYQIRVNQFDVEQTSQLLNLPLKIQPLDQSNLNYIERQRLLMGHTLVSSEGGRRVYTYLVHNQQDYVLWFEISSFDSKHIEGINAFIQYNLSRDESSFTQFLTRIVQERGLPLTLYNASTFTEEYLESLKGQTVSTQYALTGRGTVFTSYLQDQKKIVEIGPVEFQSFITIQSVFIALVFAIILAGISVYWLVQKFELGLQRLERASSRVASGHLNSRVKVSSQDSIGRLGLSFNRMAEQIQRLMGIQKEMIRAVSHELRTPVARMRFGVQMLEDSVEDGYVQKQLGDMDQDLQELDELVDEILTYARLEEGGPILEFKSANMLELIQQIQEETKRRTDKVDITCHSEHIKEEETFSDIEFRYMHRAVQNLVGNACRYASGKVHIEYSFKDDICRIDVEDDGQGIPEKDWDRVFSPFTRLDDSRTRASGGYGLGLSIVRRIIYWHAGRAQVSKSRWGGAKMSLIWPKKVS
jgi:two-component system sensor histidine kinase RstB